MSTFAIIISHLAGLVPALVKSHGFLTTGTQMSALFLNKIKGCIKMNVKMNIPVGTAWVNEIKDIKRSELQHGDNSGFIGVKIKEYTVLFELAWCEKYVICAHILHNDIKIEYIEDYNITVVKREVLAYLKRVE